MPRDVPYEVQSVSRPTKRRIRSESIVSRRGQARKASGYEQQQEAPLFRRTLFQRRQEILDDGEA